VAVNPRRAAMQLQDASSNPGSPAAAALPSYPFGVVKLACRDIWDAVWFTAFTASMMIRLFWLLALGRLVPGVSLLRLFYRRWLVKSLTSYLLRAARRLRVATSSLLVALRKTE